MPHFLFPVEGLLPESAWVIGPVTFREPNDVATLIQAQLGGSSKSSAMFTDETLAEFGQWVAADVEAHDIDGALVVVRDALHLLRVFQYTRAQMQPTLFGLPGEPRPTHLWYLQLGETGGLGWRQFGVPLGFTFRDDERAYWESLGFSELAKFIGRSGIPEGPARLLLAIRLLSQAALDLRPEMRLLLTVIATETLLGRGRTFKLARRAAFLTCGRPENDPCGRDRPACVFLTLNPSVKTELKELEKCKEEARSDPAARCSEWLDFVFRYNDRSGIAHGELNYEVPKKDADQDLYWAIHYLLPAALPWLLKNSDKPIVALDAEIAALVIKANTD
jgi:hypothetical protein